MIDAQTHLGSEDFGVQIRYLSFLFTIFYWATYEFYSLTRMLLLAKMFVNIALVVQSKAWVYIDKTIHVLSSPARESPPFWNL